MSQIPFNRTTASAQLDLLRGLAAIVVCLEHWRNLLFVDYPTVAQHRTLFAVPYVLSGAGHQAVIIFFVLSGYLIGGSVFRMFAQNRWSWKRYMTHRLVRLWLVLLPALVLGGALDLLGITLGRAPALYAGQVQNHMLSNVSQALTPGIFAGNLLFVQGIFVATLGSNGALWSLANEFWYYILFPLCILALHRKSSPAVRILSGAFILGIAFMVGKGIMLAFPIWLMGAMLALLPVRRVSGLIRTVAVLLYVPAFFFLAKTKSVSGNISDYILAGATFLLLWLVLSARTEAGKGLWVRFARGTSHFSYTLYLVHTPFIVLMVSLAVHDSRWQPSLRTILPALVILAGAIGYAYLVAALTEFRTDSVRKWIEVRVVGITPKQAAGATG